MTAIPACPDCGSSLHMCRRYLTAPSIAWCTGCLWLFDVEYDLAAGAWKVLGPSLPKPEAAA